MAPLMMWIAVCVSTFFVLGRQAIASSMACPFCASVNLTFTDQIAAKDVVVSAALIDAPPLPDDPDADLPRATFKITKVLKGETTLSQGMEFEALLVGRHPPGRIFLVMGLDPPDIAWTTPIKASPVLLKYLEDLQTLPESGPDRLAFFQDYFEHEESSIAFDAYDEFAKAPYADLIALKDRMNRQQLLSWITDKDTSINRRRLYLTMLGVCGTESDGTVLEKMLTDGGDSNLRGMDALVACYLCLKGEDGVELVEKEFLLNEESDFTTTMGALSALRFHGTEVDIISRDRVVAAIRKLLDRSKMADLVISDLARWEDWSVTDKLVAMFKESKEENRWLRVPIVNFLMASPEPRAKEYLTELKKIDPGAVQRAELFGGGFGDEDDDDSDAEREDTDAKESQTLPDSGMKIARSTPLSFVSTGPFKETDPFAELDRELAAQQDQDSDGSPAESVTVQHKTYKVPIVSGNPAVVAALPAATIPVQVIDPNRVVAAGGETKEVSSLSASVPQSEANPVAIAAPAETDVAAVPPIAAAVPATPVAAVPYLTLKIILIPFLCSVVLFFLLWSVVNGSFQRLIF